MPWVKQRANSPFSFDSIQTLKGLDDAHLGWCEGSSLLSLLIQTLTSSGNTLTGTSSNYVLTTIEASLSLVRLTQKINNHQGK